MKKFLLFALTVCVLASCDNTPAARMDVTVAGAPDTTVVLQRLVLNRLQAVDTIKTDAQGHFNYKVSLEGNAPYFYYIYYGQTPVAAMVLLPKDNVTVKTSVNGSYEIEGSEESSKLKEANAMFDDAVRRMSVLADEALVTEDQARIAEINKQLSRIYIEYKRAATKFVITNPYSIASAVVLFQKFNENLPVFSEVTDALIFKSVQDSLATVYPSSEFLVALRDEASSREKQLQLETRFSNVEEVSFPNIAMPDVNGQMQNLTQLQGNVIILSFWSVNQSVHKMFNQELLEVYDRYHSQGLEIFQVSVDTDKAAWASSVKNQNIPWICVNDGLGINSIAVSLYNLQSIPAIFVFDREGNLQATDVFDAADLEKIVKKCI